MDTLKAIIPSAGVVFIFWLAIRGLIHADRRERAAQARFAASGRTAGGRPAPSGPRPGTAQAESEPPGESVTSGESEPEYPTVSESSRSEDSAE
jgi:hypothetical protein